MAAQRALDVYEIHCMPSEHPIRHVDHRSAEQKATDEQHAKEQRKAEAALIAKQHKYEKDQERLIQEQAVEAGEALAKQLQQAVLAPTPSTAGENPAGLCTGFLHSRCVFCVRFMWANL